MVTMAKRQDSDDNLDCLNDRPLFLALLSPGHTQAVNLRRPGCEDSLNTTTNLSNQY